MIEVTSGGSGESIKNVEYAKIVGQIPTDIAQKYLHIDIKEGGTYTVAHIPGHVDGLEDVAWLCPLDTPPEVIETFVPGLQGTEQKYINFFHFPLRLLQRFVPPHTPPTQH